MKLLRTEQNFSKKMVLLFILYKTIVGFECAWNV